MLHLFSLTGTYSAFSTVWHSFLSFHWDVWDARWFKHSKSEHVHPTPSLWQRKVFLWMFQCRHGVQIIIYFMKFRLFHLIQFIPDGSAHFRGNPPLVAERRKDTSHETVSELHHFIGRCVTHLYATRCLRVTLFSGLLFWKAHIKATWTSVKLSCFTFLHPLYERKDEKRHLQKPEPDLIWIWFSVFIQTTKKRKKRLFIVGWK